MSILERLWNLGTGKLAARRNAAGVDEEVLAAELAKPSEPGQAARGALAAKKAARGATPEAPDEGPPSDPADGPVRKTL